MFKKKTTEEKVVPAPQKIEELEEPVVETPKVKKKEPSTEVPVAEDIEPELTEDQVKGWMENVAAILTAQEKRIARIEYHLRLDF